MSDEIGVNRLSILLNSTADKSDSDAHGTEEANKDESQTESTINKAKLSELLGGNLGDNKPEQEAKPAEENKDSNQNQDNVDTKLSEPIGDKLIIQFPKEDQNAQQNNQSVESGEKKQQTENPEANTAENTNKNDSENTDAETKLSPVIKEKLNLNGEKDQAPAGENNQSSEKPANDSGNQKPEEDFAPEPNNNTESLGAQTDDYTTGRSNATAASHKKSSRPLEIPPNLKPYVTDPPGSLIYKTLTGIIPLNLEQDDYTNLLTNLSRYVDVCIDHDLIGEAVYVQGLANELRADKASRNPKTKATYDEIDQKIKETKSALDQVNQHWDKQIEAVKEDTTTRLQLLNEKYLQALDQLDQQWSAPDKSQQYQKPSAELLNMRNMLAKMVKSRKLDHVEAISAQIEAREKEETEAMQKRMQEDYDVADKKLTKTYQVEQAMIINYSEKTISDIEHTKQRSVSQYIKRLEILEREKSVLLSKNKDLDVKEDENKTHTAQPSAREKSSRRSTKMFSEQKLPDFVATAKLKAPTFVPKKRDRSKSLSNVPMITKPKTHKSNPMSRLYDGV